MKKMSEFLPQNFQFLVVKFSIYMNRRVFVMYFCHQLICKYSKSRYVYSQLVFNPYITNAIQTGGKPVKSLNCVIFVFYVSFQSFKYENSSKP